MRSYPSCWNKTLARLGFKRKARTRQQAHHRFRRRSLFEQLETRQLLTLNSVVVDTEVNTVGDDGLTSLKEAFDLVATDPQLDTIEFSPSLAGKTITFPAAEPIHTEVNIIGPNGLLEERITLDAQGSNRFFFVGAAGILHLENLILNDGNIGAGVGGAIANYGAVTLDTVDIINSEAAGGSGGAIFSANASTLSIVDGLLQNNSARNGGAISFTSGAPDGLSIKRTTFFDNHAVGSNASGGALHLGGSSTDATITNSTFSANDSEQWGGAIQVFGVDNTLDLVNTTINDNFSDGTVGGVRNSSTGIVTLANTVVAENTASWAYTVDGEGDLSGSSNMPSSNNLIGVGYSGLMLSHGANVNQIGAADAPLDPMLLPLALSTDGKLTHPPEDQSPLIDAGSNLAASSYGLDTDQRGSDALIVNRVHNKVVDIGAHESGSQPVGFGQPFVVNDDYTVGDQSNPWVATNRFGQTVVVWFGEGPEGTGLYTQIVNSWQSDSTASNATSLPRLVAGAQVTESIPAQVAIDDEGSYAVTWVGTEDERDHVFLRRYRADGAPIDAVPVRVSILSSHTDPPRQASIVANGAGSLIVTWLSSSSALKYRRYTTGGLSLDAYPQAATLDNAGEITLPTSKRVAAIQPDGSFYLQWGQHDSNGNLQLKVQAYSATGTRVGDALQYASDLEDHIQQPSFNTSRVQSYSEGPSQVLPYDIITDVDGNVVVSWVQRKDWTDVIIDSTESYTWIEREIFYRRFHPDSGWDEVIKVESAPSTIRNVEVGAPYDDYYDLYHADILDLDSPGLAADDSGRIGIAWGKRHWELLAEAEWVGGALISSNYEVGGSRKAMVRWFDRDDHELADDPLEIQEFFTDSDWAIQPSLASDGSGGFLLTGYVDGDILGQRYQLPQSVRLDGDGELRITDSQSTLDEIVVRSEFRNGKRLVVLNDVVTTIATEQVQSIRIIGGARDNFIDVSRVTQTNFPNLESGGITIAAGSGNDEVHASDLGGTIEGGAGDDRIFGALGVDHLDGGAGDDTITGGFSADTLVGGSGDDSLRGGLGDDVLQADDGNDRLFGDAGNDTLDGGAGDDHLDGGTGTSDNLVGGIDNDTYFLIDSSATTVTISDLGGVDTIDLSDSTSRADLALTVATSAQNQIVFR
ncbi:MAG: choice-of-anchor Q domain-containing protein, partial [Planctomycetota bacterium]